MSHTLTAEAFGTLLALSELGRARMVEPRVRSELLAAGLVECSGDLLLITAKGRQLSETRDVGQVLGLQARFGRRGEQRLGFLTIEANAVVVPVHPKAIPVILRNEAEFEGWLTAPADVGLALKRPLPDDEIMIVGTGE